MEAANIVEALEVGCTTLLIDEDTCATNFMIRDASGGRKREGNVKETVEET